MRLCFINPNSTASMTEKVAIAARAAAADGTEIVALTSPTGPASIQGPEDGDAAVPGLL
jgi:allantoin racemase